MNVTLRQLNAFVAVAKTGGFTDAAGKLHITQSALSGLVKELESALEVQLLHRTTRSVQLSEIGADFLPLAQRILDDLERALRSIAELKSLNAGHVRIAVPQLMACTLIPDAVAVFKRRYPQVDVLVVDAVVEEVSQRVLGGEVDLAVGPQRELGDGLAARPLLDMPFLAVFSDGHPLGQLEQVRWSDLVCYPLISMQGEYTRMLNAALLASPARIELNPVFEVAFMTTALSMVSAGLGVTTCLPYASSLIDLHRLQTRPLIEPVITRRFHIYARADRTPGPAAQRFADFLVEYAQRQGWGAAV